MLIIANQVSSQNEVKKNESITKSFIVGNETQALVKRLKT